MGAPAGEAPSIVLLPELCIGPNDVSSVRDLIRAARQNTLLICGIGHMAAAEIDPIEAGGPLFGEPVARHYANCAPIGCSGMPVNVLTFMVISSYGINPTRQLE
jgi:hypothetical protein